MIRRVSPSILTSVPLHLPYRTLSPALTSRAVTLPSSPRAPGPAATISPCCGFSLAVSGMMMPPAVLFSCSVGFTTTRSCKGLNFIGISPRCLSPAFSASGDCVSTQGQRVLARITTLCRAVKAHTAADGASRRKLQGKLCFFLEGMRKVVQGRLRTGPVYCRLRRRRTASRRGGMVVVAAFEPGQIGLVQSDVQMGELLIVMPFQHIAPVVQPSESRPVLDPDAQIDSYPVGRHVAVEQAEQLVQPIAGQG